MSNNKETLVFGPGSFIMSPYINCPECKKQQFGILIIRDDSYCRRCKNCLFPRGFDERAEFSLPQLDKQVVYLDQFVLSNMMKALNPESKANRTGKDLSFWKRLFERLDYLGKLHLFVCPESSIHGRETVVSSEGQAIRRMINQLSSGIHFQDTVRLKHFQLRRHAGAWLKGEDCSAIQYGKKEAIHGELNGWRPRTQVSLTQSFLGGFVDEIRDARTSSHNSLTKLFERWQLEPKRTFNDYLEIKFADFIRTLHRDYISTIFDVMHENGVPEEQLESKTREYLNDPQIRTLPWNRIGAHMYAAIARRASAGGQKKPPSAGMMNDISMLESLLRYCDAVFVDKECHQLLREEPLRSQLSYRAKVFSLSNKDEFLKYLQDVEQNVTPVIEETIRTIYGPKWLEPFDTLYLRDRADGDQDNNPA